MHLEDYGFSIRARQLTPDFDFFIFHWPNLEELSRGIKDIEFEYMVFSILHHGRSVLEIPFDSKDDNQREFFWHLRDPILDDVLYPSGIRQDSFEICGIKDIADIVEKQFEEIQKEMK